MHELIENKFEFILSAVSAEGLDSSWLGRKITKTDVESLSKLNKKVGLNIAGEGGEFESFVVYCPLFKKKIVLFDTKIIDEKTNAKAIFKAKIE
jgi:diphthine-ammonia ligase